MTFSPYNAVLANTAHPGHIRLLYLDKANVGDSIVDGIAPYSASEV